MIKNCQNFNTCIFPYIIYKTKWMLNDISIIIIIPVLNHFSRPQNEREEKQKAGQIPGPYQRTEKFVECDDDNWNS